MIDRQNNLSVTSQCQLMSLIRSKIYFQPKGASEEDLACTAADATNGDKARYLKKGTIRPGKGHKIYTYLLKGLDINRVARFTAATLYSNGQGICLSGGDHGLVQP
jgi:hypothetical protein